MTFFIVYYGIYIKSLPRLEYFVKTLKKYHFCLIFDHPKIKYLFIFKDNLYDIIMNGGCARVVEGN